MKYEIPERVKNNLITFLNRTTFTGFKEMRMLNEICVILSTPPPKEQEDKKCQST